MQATAEKIYGEITIEMLQLSILWSKHFYQAYIKLCQASVLISATSSRKIGMRSNQLLQTQLVFYNLPKLFNPKFELMKSKIFIN